ncbi:MAG: DUF5615 family PIN-like protein [Kineosporiaceae bacterium]
MKLVLDHHMSPVLAERLRDGGHDVVAASERGWQRVPDEDLLRLASAERRAVTTANVRHFVPIVRSCGELGEDHWGVLLVSASSFSLRASGIGQAVQVIGAVLHQHSSEDAFRNRVHWL